MFGGISSLPEKQVWHNPIFQKSMEPNRLFYRVCYFFGRSVGRVFDFCGRPIVAFGLLHILIEGEECRKDRTLSWRRSP